MFPYQELLAILDSDLAFVSDRFDQSFVTCDMDPAEVAALQLRKAFFKKLLPTGDLSAAQVNAGTEKFLRINRSISQDPFVFPAETEEDALFWDYFRDNVDKVLNPCEADFSLESLREKFATGPGAAIDGDSRTFYTKMFESRLTASNEYIITLFRGLVVGSDTWCEAERLRNAKYGTRVVEGNRLFFVPKDTETARTCCTEPALNMVVQQAIAGVMTDRLAECFGISLSTQPVRNQILAMRGSTDGTFCTIDLESASDSISWSLVQRILRGTLLGLIRHARSPITTLPSGEMETLNMVSTMGNAFTFPLQTIIFSCVVRATYSLMGFRSSAPELDFAVFGDDIVVRREAYSFVCRMLSKLGFKVNEAKSFAVGPFRESCGHDYFSGTYVRGVYIRSLETHSAVYSAINRLQRWSALHEIPLYSTISFLLTFVPRRDVPRSESDDAGVKVPFYLTRPIVTNAYWFAYRKLVSVPKRWQVPDTEEEALKLGYEGFNPYGLAISYLGGFARRDDRRPFYAGRDELPESSHPAPSTVGYFTLRAEGSVGRFKVVQKSIPYWDWPGHLDSPEKAVLRDGRWESSFSGLS